MTDMTRTPTPGPLSGDWPVVTDKWVETYCDLTGRDPDGGSVTFLGDGPVSTSFRDAARREIEAMLCAAPKSAIRSLAPTAPVETLGHAAAFAANIDTAPVEASGSELHPKTADLVDRFAAELKSKLAKAEAKYGYAADWLKPDWQDELTESLAEHIQKGDPRDVAAYCAFAWHHGWSTSDASEHFAPNFHFQTNRDQIAKCIRRAVGDAWIGDAQAEVAAEAVLSLRPQPSGETRPGGYLVKDFADGWYWTPNAAIECATGSPVWSVQNARYETKSEALIRPAPVASGGQHSSAPDFPHGEVTDEWAERFCEAVNWSPDGQECKAVEGQVRCVSFRDLAKGYILSAIATQPAITSVTAPVAETAGEAVGVVSGCARADLYTADLPTGTPLYAAPVPAQDDDKLREAAIVAKNMADNASFNLNQAGLTPETATCERAFVDIYRALDDGLKSTAAQDGGE